MKCSVYDTINCPSVTSPDIKESAFSKSSLRT